MLHYVVSYCYLQQCGILLIIGILSIIYCFFFFSPVYTLKNKVYYRFTFFTISITNMFYTTSSTSSSTTCNDRITIITVSTSSSCASTAFTHLVPPWSWSIRPRLWPSHRGSPSSRSSARGLGCTGWGWWCTDTPGWPPPPWGPRTGAPGPHAPQWADTPGPGRRRAAGPGTLGSEGLQDRGLVSVEETGVKYTAQVRHVKTCPCLI